MHYTLALAVALAQAALAAPEYRPVPAKLFQARADADGRSLEEVMAEEAQRIPVGRLAQPEDLAALVVFLASEPARHISGTTIQVDGGATGAVF